MAFFIGACTNTTNEKKNGASSIDVTVEKEIVVTASDIILNDKEIGEKSDMNAIVEILRTIRSKITNKTDVSWSGADSVEAFKAEMDKDIINLAKGDTSSLNTYYMYFLPTGDFQEISMSNGWGEAYLKLATEFDIHYQKIK